MSSSSSCRSDASPSWNRQLVRPASGACGSRPATRLLAMSTPSTSAPSFAAGNAVVPSPQPRSRTSSPRDRRAPRRAPRRSPHALRDASEVALLPECLVRITGHGLSIDDPPGPFLPTRRSHRSSAGEITRRGSRLRQAASSTQASCDEGATCRRCRRLPCVSRMQSVPLVERRREDSIGRTLVRCRNLEAPSSCVVRGRPARAHGVFRHHRWSRRHSSG